MFGELGDQADAAFHGRPRVVANAEIFHNAGTKRKTIPKTKHLSNRRLPLSSTMIVHRVLRSVH
jgi:hypothetical protein